MTAEFIQDCGSDTPLLRAYAKRESKAPDLMNAGLMIKLAIEQTGVSGYFPFTVKNLSNRTYFRVQRWTYQKQLYAVVTNSAINYIFKIHQ